MSCAEKQNWYKSTLFIITADHTGPELDIRSGFASKYRVPLIMFNSQLNLNEYLNRNYLVQHIDIVPTLADLLGVELTEKNYLAQSLLRPSEKTIVLYSDSKYELLGSIKNEKEQLKAAEQYFSEAMYKNKLYYKDKSE